MRRPGFSFSVEIRPNSSSLRNKNFRNATGELEDGEELLVVVPSDTLRLVATPDHPNPSAEFVGKFTLRDGNRGYT